MSQHTAICPADLPSNVFTLQRTGQLAALFTIIRDTKTHRGDFVFYADRICRLLIEEGKLLTHSRCSSRRELTPKVSSSFIGLNHLPVVDKCERDVS